ncbi:STN and carboxypeptidase regulatory-like domain-containing protein [Pedobacter gandavensis]|uniref:STN and carboxypeptidase regulatory-like domain-containing protein n=1 Tax=Pedobacter TaxID=84567 RepID=UPI001C99BC5C|nr:MULTISPECIES: STN and carboxypeptidase regulatory-like domain-containing protein [Pedobacter]WGQ11119.1 STN and carboxypeptidase regulatory-like domain-containing protein [Pedobacter gandavensis]
MKTKLTLFLLILFSVASAQSPEMTSNVQRNLSRRLSFTVKQEPISQVLNKMSKAGDFYFAYNGALFNQDSLVNMNIRNMPVRTILDQMFDGKVDYKESENYVILRYAVNHLTIEPDNITTADNLYLISGYVIDTQTGRKIKQASVYEKRLLQSTLTDNDGYFKLRFKGEHKEVILTASKETYRDTALVFLADITIKPESYDDPDKEKGTVANNAIEELGISRFFISSTQRIQNLNIPSFFANTPFQASLTPGLSSHGMMSSKVINKVSLNVIGGYTAGVDGFEIAGLFNLSKGEVRALQVAGAFNVVGGSVQGIQVAGLHNDVRTNMKGLQVAGALNVVKRNAEGFQIAGLANMVTGDMKGFQTAGALNVNIGNKDGFQVSGLVNINSRNSRGVEIAGLANISSRTSSGIQIAGLFNIAKNNTGFQLALLNFSGSSTGTSLGLLNFVGDGYHKFSVSTNELVQTNVALKTGNANLYNILFIGKTFTDTAKIATLGLGFGHDFIFSKHLSVAPELSFQYLYLGNWKYSNILTKFQMNLQIQLLKGIAIFGGPAYSFYNSDAPIGSSSKNYKQQVVPDKHHSFSGNNKGWYGWNAGITFF